MSLICVGCASTELIQTTQDIDTLVQNLVKAPAPAPAARVGPADLLAQARQNGPSFIAGAVETARAELDLDAQKSVLRPRLSVGVRTRVEALGANRSTGTDVFVGLDWDIARAIGQFGKEGLSIAEQLISVQARLTENAATGELFEAYSAYRAAILSQREAEVRHAAAQCRLRDLGVELSLGNISASDIEQAKVTVSNLAQLQKASRKATEATRRQTAYLAGLSEDTAFARYTNPGALFKPVPENVTRETCYQQSGNAARDTFLLAGATLGIRAAKLSRYGTFDLGLPSQLTPGSGLNIDVLISLIAPLVDQGDGTRRVQEARLAVLEILLAGERNRRRFDLTVSEIRTNLASAAIEVDRALDTLQREQSSSASLCSRQETLALAQVELDRARLSQDFERTRLALLCAPSAVPDSRPNQARSAAFDALQQ